MLQFEDPRFPTQSTADRLPRDAFPWLASTVLHEIDRLNDSPAPVLITGEPGTGHEIVARQIHTRGHRRLGPFALVSCTGQGENWLEQELFGQNGTVPEVPPEGFPGRIEEAHLGTLYLDELAHVPSGLLDRLFGVVQDRTVSRPCDSRRRNADIRLICATLHEPRQLVAGVFKGPEIVRRFGKRVLKLPPLRDRLDELEMITKALLGAVSATVGRPFEQLSDEALNQLRDHHWPGNLIELHSVLESGALRASGPIIKAADLPPLDMSAVPVIQVPSGLSEEHHQLLAALSQVNGNRARAARLLGMSRATLYRRLQSFHLI